MSKKVITFGEIMLRLATPDYLRFCQANQFNATFGGGEANVAASLANYGIETEDDRLGRGIQGCLLVSLDRYHASHIRRCRQRMLGSDTGGKPIGHHGILRPQLPEKSLEIR